MLGGPFLGLRLSTAASWGSIAAYLSGTYEEELHPWIAEAVKWQPSVVADIGAAEGYYAVGLARLLPCAVIHAFDIDPEARQVCKRTIELNRADNVRPRGRISARLLERTLASRSLVICDCEGYELQLLDPALAPSLKSAFIIVELHDFIDPSISTVVVRRFEATHTIQVVHQGDKAEKARPHLAHLTSSEMTAATDEGRPGGESMQWAVLIPLDTGAA